MREANNSADQQTHSELRTVLARYRMEDARCEPLPGGLINRSWLIRRDGERYVLQRMNGIFPPGVNDDIARVTDHLRARGLVTPRLVPTAEGTSAVIRDGVWRLLTYVPGSVHKRLRRPQQARSAGRLLGRFHRALWDYDAPFTHARLGVHDTAAHLAALRLALEKHATHAAFARVAPLAERILQAADSLEPLAGLPDRAVHGDPKLTNIVFRAGSDEAVCLIDLDTLARMPLALELGDALRSWCNVSGEDSETAEFSPDLLHGAVNGYAAEMKGLLTPPEVRSLVPGLYRIAVELAARFCADALNERYFAWDAGRYPSSSEHNRVRAAGQLALAAAVQRRQRPLEALVAAAFAD